MINDTLTGSVPGANGTPVDVTTALLNGPVNVLTGSPLLYDLWYNNTVPVNLGNNPTAGAGTGTFIQNGVATVWIDPAIYPGAPAVTIKGGGNESFASPNIDELGERIGHELAHAELPNANNSYLSASTLGQAVTIGELNEGAGYTAQYVIAEQLSDIGNGANPANTSFKGLNQVFKALQTVAAQDSPFFLTLDTASELINSQFYEDAVGTLSAPGLVSLAIATLQSQVSKDPAFTQLDKWQDQWILNSVYHISALLGNGTPTAQYSYFLSGLTHSCITVKSDGQGGWTFVGNNIPIVLTNLAAPDNTAFTANATLSFTGGSDSAANGIRQGDYTIAGAGTNGQKESLLYGGTGGPTTYTLAGLSGTDWYFVQVPTAKTDTVTIDPYKPLLGSASGAGGILLNNTLIGGSAGQQVKPDSQGGADHWSDGQLEYVYNLKADTLTITNANGQDGQIVIDRFNLTQAESSTGFLGIFLQGTGGIKAGSNTGTTPAQNRPQMAVRADAATNPAAPNFIAGTSQDYTVWVDAASGSSQTVTLTLSGVPASDFGVDTGSGLTALNSQGTFTITIPAGETSATFTLQNTADVGQSTSMQLSAVFQDQDTGATVSGGSLTQSYVEPTDDPFGQPAAPSLYLLENAFTPQGQPYSVYTNQVISQSPVGGVGSGNNYISISGAADQSIAGGPGNDTIYASFGQETTGGVLTDAGVDVITGGGGQDDIIVGSAATGPNSAESPTQLRIYAGSQVDLPTAIANANSGAATGQQGDLIISDSPNATIVGSNGNDLIIDSGNDVVVAGPGNETIVSGVFGVDDSLQNFGGGISSVPAAGQTWSDFLSGANQVFFSNNLYDYGTWNGPPPPAGYEGNYDNFANPFLDTDSTIFGGSGKSLIELSNGDNDVELGTGNATVLGGMGDNTIIGGGGFNSLVGGGGNDYIDLGPGGGVAVGQGGNNTIFGGGGSDTIYVGDEVFPHYVGDETGNNYAQAGSGNTVIDGADGNDTLVAGSGNDTIQGGGGNEYILGGTGILSVNGGTGNETIDAGESSSDTIWAGTGNATIYGSGVGADTIHGGTGTNVIYVGSGGTGDIPDDVFVGSGATTVYGGDGVDNISGGSGPELIYGGEGGTWSAPTGIFAGTGAATIYGGSGIDYIQGNTGPDVLYGSSGGTDSQAGLVTSGSGPNTLYGGAGPNILVDSLSGGDLIVSNSADDTLIGVGSDTLVAGTGDDLLQADSGSVSMVFNAGFGNDTILAGGGVGNISFGTGLDPDDFYASLATDSLGDWYVNLVDGGSSVDIEDALTEGDAGTITFADSGPISLSALLSEALGADQQLSDFDNPQDNLIITLGDGESVVAGQYNDTLSSWGYQNTLIGGSNNQGDNIFAAGDSASIASGTGGDTITATGDNTTVTGGSSGDAITVSGANSVVTSTTGADSITASGTHDTLIGGSGNSIFTVNDPSTVINAPSGGGADTVVSSVTYTAPANVNVLILTGSANIASTGNAGSDSLIGGAGADTLIAGSGVDTLIAGSGNTTFVINSTADVVEDSYTTTLNQVQSSVSYSLPNDVSTLVLTGSQNLVGTAGNGNDVLVSNSGVDTLIGGNGNDTFIINNSADIIELGSGTNSLVDTNVSYTLPVSVTSLTLTGTANLVGTAISGNDTLISNGGVDTLIGGNGVDTFVVNNSADVVQDSFAYTGNTLLSSVSFVLPTNVNVLTLIGSAALTATGNAAADVITANSGADTLIAGTGTATLVGGSGSDTFEIDNTADVVQDTYTSGVNTIDASVSYSLVTNVTTLVLAGAGGLIGRASSVNDTLVADSVNDTLVGGAGNETFVVNSTGDVVQDTFTTTSNILESSVSYTLAANVNTLILAGTAAIVGTSNGGNDSLIGNAGADTLVATTGLDTLIAGSGVATLEGGTGNDVFVVNNASDVVVAGSSGSDTVLSSISYTLPTGVNALVLSGTANLTGAVASGNNSIIGNAGNDVLRAGSGSDTLIAGSGIDTLVGGTGADTFVINSTADVLESVSAAATNQLVSSISYTLPGNINILGLSGSTSLVAVGNGGRDTLTANAGSDTLIGGGGVVDMIGGAGPDLFVVDNGADTVSSPDYSSKGAVDTIDASLSYTLPSTVAILQLTGTANLVGAGNSLADSIVGNAGDDTLEAGTGADTLIAGSGLATLVGYSGGGDTFVIDNSADVIQSAGSGAANTLISSVSYTLPTNVTTLLLTGDAALGGTANSTGNDLLVGNGAADTLVAGTGNDTLSDGGGSVTMVAGSGTDTFIVSNTGDLIQGGSGDAIVSAISMVLPENIDALTLTGAANIEGVGNSGNDILTGGAGNDTLVAGTGLDTLIGGSGNTTFVIDNASDVVEDSAAGAINTLETSVSYSLPTDVNVLLLTGTASLTGKANGGKDTLISNSGVDTLIGGGGNDTFAVNNASDVIEAGAANTSDTILATVNYTLGTGINTLVLAGTANLEGTANGANDSLVSNAGVDTLIGGGGNDIFVVNNASDVVLDTYTNTSNLIQSAVNYSLLSTVNSLILTNESLVGTANSGADTLTAGSALDTLVAGTGNDLFVLSDTSDVVVDSSTSSSDTIQSSVNYSLSGNVNTLVLTGAFKTVGTANSGNDTLISNTGIDTLVAGTGNDLFVLNNAADVVQFGASYGIDSIETYGNYTAPAAVSSVTFLGASSITGAVSNPDQVMRGNAGSDHLTATNYGDTIYAGTGNDQITSGYGYGGNLLVGGIGNDTFTTYGQDTVVAGTGSDVLDVSYQDPDDPITLVLNSGFTHVYAYGSQSFAEGQPINLEFGPGFTLSSLNISFVPDTSGNGTDLQITAGGSTLDVAYGFVPGIIGNISFADGTSLTLGQLLDEAQLPASRTTVGGALFSGVTADSLVGGAGIDALVAWGNNSTLTSGSDNVQYEMYAWGNGDILYGNSWGSDLYASGAADTLVGGTGDSDYYVNNSTDVVDNSASEYLGGIFSSVSYSLPSDVYELDLTGTAALVGTAGDDPNGVAIRGNAGNDTLQGDTTPGANSNLEIFAGTGNQVLIGGNGTNELSVEGPGNDTFIAGAGVTGEFHDGPGTALFIINNTAVSVSEYPGYNYNDTLESSVSFTAPQSVNTLILTGTANLTVSEYNATGNQYIVTNSGNDSIVTDGGGNDTVMAGNGNDTIVTENGVSTVIAGSGNDLFEIYNAADVLEVTAPGGNDTLQYYGLPGSFTLLPGIDTLLVTTNAGHVAATGNADPDSMTSYGLNTLTAGSGADTLTSDGYYGSDTLIGGAGPDTFIVGPQATGVVIQDIYANIGSVVESALSFSLPQNVDNLMLTGSGLVGTGNSDNDSITESSGNNTLIAGSGVDTLIGTGGNDLFVLNNPLDVVEDLPGSNNTIEAAYSYALSNAEDALILTGTANLTGTASSGNDTLTSNSGVDTLIGGSGSDVFIVNNAADVISAVSATNTLYSTATYTLPTSFNQLFLTGTAALMATANGVNDTLVANSGGDTLVSASATADSLVGGHGNDLFIVNSTSDTVTAGSSPGVDTIQSTVSFNAATGVANLVFTGSANVTGTGNSVADTIVANSGTDTLTAGTGVATFYGGAGNDTFVVDNTGDTVTDTYTTTTNTVRSSVKYSLPTNVNILVLTGNTALTGAANSGADTLTANAGATTLFGGAGNDVFIVSSTANVIQDTWTNTTNSLQSSVTYSLPTNINTLTFTGATAVKGTGNAANDLLAANTGADTLVAGNGNDTLMAGTGTAADSLVGGTGNDLFIVAHTGDAVTMVGASHGSDTIQSSVSFTASAFVATLTLTGTGNIVGTGNALADVITANSGTDTLTAGTGLATLYGGAGNDTFVIDNTGDSIQDTYTNTANVLSSSVSYSLPTNVNRLILTNGSVALLGTANSGNDTLTANSGLDTLVSGAGIDSLVAGSGSDIFIVNNTADIVTVGATHGTDTLESSVSFTAATNVADLTLIGTAAIVGTGNSLANIITANGAADTLVAGSGVATLVAGAGTDTFVVNSSKDVISGVSAGTADVVSANFSYTLPTTLSYLTLTGTAALTGTGGASGSAADLIIGNSGNDTLTGGSSLAVLEGGRTGGSDQIKATVAQAALIAGGGSSTLTGGAFKDFLAAGLVSDSITTGATANVIAVNKGDGATTIQATSGASDVLSLGAGIDAESLTLAKGANNSLVLRDGVTGDSITFANWYASTADQNVTKLQVVEIASASYNASGTDPLRNHAVEEFNFSALVADLNSASGSPTSLSLSTSQMTAAELSSSSTAAYGGDLAYYDGLNGNLSGMTLAAAQAALTSTSYATAAQTIDSWSSISTGGPGLQLAAAEPNYANPVQLAWLSADADSPDTSALQGSEANTLADDETSVLPLASAPLLQHGIHLARPRR